MQNSFIFLHLLQCFLGFFSDKKYRLSKIFKCLIASSCIIRSDFHNPRITHSGVFKSFYFAGVDFVLKINRNIYCISDFTFRKNYQSSLFLGGFVFCQLLYAFILPIIGLIAPTTLTFPPVWISYLPVNLTLITWIFI